MHLEAPIGRDRHPSTLKRWLLLASVVVATTPVAILPASDLAHAAAGDLLWASAPPTIDEAADDGEAYTALATAGSTVFAAGRAPLDAGDSSLRVSAYSAKSGTLIWQQDLHANSDEDRANGLVARGGRVFIGGTVDDLYGYLAALSAKNGSVLWERFITPVGSLVDSYVLALAASGNALYALVKDFSQLELETCAVRAYDARTGELLWAMPVGYGCVQLDAQGWGNEPDGSSMLVRGSRLFVATAAYSGDTDVNAGFTIALNKKTGAVLWYRHFDHCSDSGEPRRMTSLAAAGSRVLVAGYEPSDCSSPSSIVLRSLDGGSGETRWERYLTDSIWTDYPHHPAFPHVVVRGKRAIVGGTTGVENVGPRGRVEAFDAARGTPLWEQTLDGQNEGSPDAVHHLAIAGKTVVAAGVLDDVEGSSFTVAAWDLADGTPAWTFRRAILESVPGSVSQESVAYALLPVSSKLIVAAGTIHRWLDEHGQSVPGITVVGIAAK